MKKKAYQCLLFILLLITGCQGLLKNDLPPRLTPPPTPVLTSIYGTLALTSENGRQAVELDVLTDEFSAPIAALAFTPDGQELLVVHGPTGMLRRWRVEDRQLLDAMELGPVKMAAVAFDGPGRLLAVGGDRTDPMTQDDRHWGRTEEVRIWDTRSGELVYRWPQYADFIDVVLSTDGQWVATMDPGGRGVFPIVGGLGWGTIPSSSSTRFTAFALDPTGTWMAFALDSGEVTIEEINWGKGERTRTLELQSSGEGIPQTLAIDMSRHWMAAVTTDSLIVWNLQAWPKNMVLKHPLNPSPLAGLAFSPDGTLLAVGTASGWQLWSVGDKKLLLENERATFAVAFSPDARLFAWGDAEGVIHLWGVPGP